MRSVSFILLLLSSFFYTGFAQQLTIEKERRTYSYVVSFENRFHAEPPEWLGVKDQEIHKVKRVKKMMVYRGDSTLLQTMELDSSGRHIRSGIWAGAYFKVGGCSGEGSHYCSTTYYRNGKIARSDTNITTDFYYRNGDTVMSYTRQEAHNYKSGRLLNEQNSYFNDTYLHKRIKVNRGTGIVMLNRFHRPVKGKRVYLKKRLKTDFDSLRLYATSTAWHEAWFYAHKDKGYTPIDTHLIKDHPFYKAYRPLVKRSALVSGEHFQEPYVQYDSWHCVHIYPERQGWDFTSHEWTENERGLYDTYYHLYYPQDTSKAAIAQYQEDKKKNRASGATYNADPDSQYPRQKTPLRTRQYFVRYEYYE